MNDIYMLALLSLLFQTVTSELYWINAMTEHLAYHYVPPLSNRLSHQIVGNDNSKTSLPRESIDNTTKTELVKIVLFSTWVGKSEPPDMTNSNHVHFCRANEYEYRFFYFSDADWRANIETSFLSHAWSSVYVMRDLLQNKSDKVDYYVKLDMDQIFATTESRFEEILDPLQHYNIYLTEVYKIPPIFFQSHTWILRKTEDDWGLKFINEWHEYAHWGSCSNLAAEQGAFQFAIASTYRDWLLTTLTEKVNKTDSTYNKRRISIDALGECLKGCNLRNRKPHIHHACLLQWYNRNNIFSAEELMSHPKISVYKYNDDKLYYQSPQDGYSMEPRYKTYEARYSKTKNFPMTVHPCKYVNGDHSQSTIWYTPVEVMQNISNICYMKVPPPPLLDP